MRKLLARLAVLPIATSLFLAINNDIGAWQAQAQGNDPAIINEMHRSVIAGSQTLQQSGRIGPIGIFVLATALPPAPAEANTFTAKQPPPLNNEEMRSLANQMGLKPELYSINLPTPPPPYEAKLPTFIVDGARQISFFGSNINYQDTSQQSMLGLYFGPPVAGPTPLSFEKASAIAEEFLKSRNLLTFDYVIQPPDNNYYPFDGMTLVLFKRIIAAAPQPVYWPNPQAVVMVSHNGRVMSFYNERFAQIDVEKNTALISADAAWQKMQDGKVTNFSIQPANMPSPQKQIQYWSPELKPGRQFDFIGRPFVLTPVEWQGKPLVMIGNATTSNYPKSLLDELNKTSDSTQYQPLHVTGRLNRNDKGEVGLEITDWESLDQRAFVSVPAKVQIKTDATGARIGVLDRVSLPNWGPSETAPNQMVILYPPEDLTSDTTVIVFGIVSTKKHNDIPVLSWMGMVNANDLPAPSAGTPPPEAGGPEFVSLTNVKGFVAAPQVTTIPVTLPTPPPPTPTRDATTPTPAPPPFSPVPPPYKNGDVIEALDGRAFMNVILSYDGKKRTVLTNFNVGKDDISTLSVAPSLSLGLIFKDDNGIEKLHFKRLRVWGKYKLLPPEPGTTFFQTPYNIEVDRYEVIDPDTQLDWWVGKLMTTTIDNLTVAYLQTRAGDRFMMRSSLYMTLQPLPPGPINQDDLWRSYLGPANTQILIYGGLTRQTAGGMRILEDFARHLDPAVANATQLSDLANIKVMAQPMVFREPKPQTFTVSQVEVSYGILPMPFNFGIPLSQANLKQNPNMPNKLAVNTSVINVERIINANQPANITATSWSRQANGFSTISNTTLNIGSGMSTDQTLIPVWVFKGKLEDGSKVEVMVDARAP